MKFTICSIGKVHDPSLLSAITDFTKRLNNYYKTEWLIIPPPKNAGKLNTDEQKKKEAESLLNWLQKDDYLVLLDEGGKMHSSISLAQLIQTKANESTRHIIFLIGGAFGVDETIKRRANHVWSLSALTFPHQLVRLLLSEQLYRACTIIKNEKYHHP